MKKILSLLFVFCIPFVAFADDKTPQLCLRLDYMLTGNVNRAEISLYNVQTQGEWAGRTTNLDKLQAKANMMVEVKDSLSGKVIFRTAGNGLFDEWRATDEAKSLTRSMPYTILIPRPERTATVDFFMTNSRHDTIASHHYLLNPDDILIREAAPVSYQTKYTLRSGSTADCVDLVILAEGYTKKEMKKFFRDAQRLTDDLFTYKPFDELKQHFNVIAVGAPSVDSGTSEPLLGMWKNTLLGSHFSTFYTDRYLTASNLPRIHDQLVGIPYDHIVVLVNTKTYGGGGFYNMLTLTAADNEKWSELFAHELCHGLIGLGDEYEYVSGDPLYHTDVEPYEENLTTLVDFASKWEDMYKQGKAQLVEGGGYCKEGVYRPAQDCLMRSFKQKELCPVCQRAVRRYVLGK